ncbi:hypothetical protein DPX16_2908 [Anabarilius grahami]|uniref:CD48 antigen n=1 Tax=Anabarilius grahami TaxID=495550 RepID=A0A3N0YCU5_ANAGA|nr:hypothetical protein DPX16_2908 [Anabarilius grahami]
MQKTDSGLYRARAVGDTYVAAYRVSVIDAVEAPVLTVNSNLSSSDSCTVNFTCGAHDLTINSSYQNRCSPEEVTSHEIYTLILYCSEESIICNHSNPVSNKTDKIEIKKICVYNKGQKPGVNGTKPPLQIWQIILIGVCVLLAIAIFLVFVYRKFNKVKVCGACIYAGFAEDRFKGTKGALLSTLQSVKMLNGTAYGLVDSASTRNLNPQDRKST